MVVNGHDVVDGDHDGGDGDHDGGDGDASITMSMIIVMVIILTILIIVTAIFQTVDLKLYFQTSATVSSGFCANTVASAPMTSPALDATSENDGGGGDDGDDGDGGDGVDDGDADDIARSARTFNKPNQSSPNREQMQFAM